MAQGRSAKNISTIKLIRTSRLSIENSVYCRIYPAVLPPRTHLLWFNVDYERDSPVEQCQRYESAKWTGWTHQGISPHFTGVLNLRTPTLQRCAAVPRKDRIQGSWTFVLLNSRVDSNKEERRKKQSVLVPLNPYGC